MPLKSKCYACLKETNNLKNNYCPKCISELFDNTVPNKLTFDRKEFINKRAEMSDKMSISGVQDKISLAFDSSNNLMPTAKNGKYILKPIPIHDNALNLEDIPANEHLSMLISKEIFKINTAHCGIIEFSDGELAYITKRFDYDSDGKKYDQEDFASLMNITPSTHGKDYKYDGSDYLGCSRLIKNFVASHKITIEDFFKRVLLNYLIANGDAHLKNFSLYSKPNSNEYTLTPNYDLLNTRYHINEKYGDMALSLIEDYYTPTFEAVGYYTYADFVYFAKLIELPQIRLEKIFKLANESLDKIEKKVINSFLSDNAKEFYLNTYEQRLGRINYIVKK